MSGNVIRHKKCAWCKNDTLYEAYHDAEWGVPLYDDQKLFEFLTLESFQAGLSWITILRKRVYFRKAFDMFDFNKIAKYTEKDIERLIQNKNIIRNRLKILASINNAKVFLRIIQSYGSFSKYIWQFVNNTPIHNIVEDYKKLPAKTELSDKICKDMKSHGFKFIGSTIIYSYMQAIGMVNDHEVSCFRYSELIDLK